MHTLNANKAGFAFGILLGSWHAIWSVLVALGWAQAIINFVFWMHMIRPVYVIGPFSFWIALTLVACTGLLGYMGGFFLAVLWNWLHREPEMAATHVGRSVSV